MGTNRCETAVTLPWVFKVRRDACGCRKKCGTLCHLNQIPFSLRKDSRDLVAYAEKTTLPEVPDDFPKSVRVAATDMRVRLQFRYRVAE